MWGAGWVLGMLDMSRGGGDLWFSVLTTSKAFGSSSDCGRMGNEAQERAPAGGKSVCRSILLAHGFMSYIHGQSSLQLAALRGDVAMILRSVHVMPLKTVFQSESISKGVPKVGKCRCRHYTGIPLVMTFRPRSTRGDQHQQVVVRACRAT